MGVDQREINSYTRQEIPGTLLSWPKLGDACYRAGIAKTAAGLVFCNSSVILGRPSGKE
jgi:hypothetical protein